MGTDKVPTVADDKAKAPRGDTTSGTASDEDTILNHAAIIDEKGAAADQDVSDTTRDTAPEVAAAESKDAAPTAPTSTAEDVAPEDQRTKLETVFVITALASTLFLAALDVTIVTTAIPTIAQEFHSNLGYTWVGSGYMLACAAFVPLWGKLSDIWGRKPLMLVAVGIFWVGSLLAGVSVNMAMLIAARAVQGVGGGGVIILVNICISDLFSMRQRGVYFGVMGMVWAVASAVGPVVGGVFTSRVTWRWCFYINLPISGVGMAVLFFVLKLHNPRTPMRSGLKAIDWVGAVTVIGGTLMVLLGLEFGGITYPWKSATVICLIVFGVIVIGLFVANEHLLARYPVMPLRLFRDRSNIAAFAVTFCHGMVFISGGYWLPLYFQAVLGVNSLLSGVYLLPFVLALSFTSAATGIIIRNTGKYKPNIIFGMTVVTLGIGLFIDLEPRKNFAKLVIFQIIAGVGIGPNFQSPLIALQTTVEPRDIASATATFGFIRQLATAISVVLGSVVFQNEMNKQHAGLVHDLGPEIAGHLTGATAQASIGFVNHLPAQAREVARLAYFNSLRTMWYMYVAIAALGLVASFFVRSRTLSHDHKEHKTGLKTLRSRTDDGKKKKKQVPDEEKAAQ